jgi:RNA polymerase sigma-70 factor (ECF subfamily)
MAAARPWPNVEELVPLYYAALYRYAFRLTGCGSEAEDLTQETFCSAQAKGGQLRDPTKVRSWLFSILRNAYLHRRRAGRRANQVSLDDLDRLGGLASPPAPERIEEEGLQAVLDELPEEFRSPLILYYFEELSYRDIAEHMNVPLGTVMSRLARAKEHLRRKLARDPDEEK